MALDRDSFSGGGGSASRAAVGRNFSTVVGSSSDSDRYWAGKCPSRPGKSAAWITAAGASAVR
jgi:hypothetical protein